MDFLDIVFGVIFWLYGVFWGDFVVKYIERVGFGGCGIGFSFGIIGMIVV